MEIEVSLKVRSAIKAKLLELGVHVDDELPDYIMVLVANRRSKQQMESDLELFLNENTQKFTAWLFHVLKKLEQVTLTDSTATDKKKSSTSSTTTASTSKTIKDSSKSKKKLKSSSDTKKSKSSSLEGKTKTSSQKTSSKSKHQQLNSETNKHNNNLDKSPRKLSQKKNSTDHKNEKSKSSSSDINSSSSAITGPSSKKKDVPPPQPEKTESKVQFKLKTKLSQKTEFDKKQEERKSTVEDSGSIGPPSVNSASNVEVLKSNEESTVNAEVNLHEDVLNLADDDGVEMFNMSNDLEAKQEETGKQTDPNRSADSTKNEEESEDKLREIALGSASRKKLGTGNVDTLKGIVMSNEKENTRRKRQNEESKDSKSNSPRGDESKPKKLRSVVNTSMLKKSEEYDPNRPALNPTPPSPKISSVVRVTSSQRPKRNIKDMNTNLIFKAMKEVEIDNIKRPIRRSDSRERDYSGSRERRRSDRERSRERERRHSIRSRSRSRSRDKERERDHHHSYRDRHSDHHYDRHRETGISRVSRNSDNRSRDRNHSARSRSPLQLFTKRGRMNVRDRLGERQVDTEPVEKEEDLDEYEIEEVVELDEDEIRAMESDLNIVINVTNEKSVQKPLPSPDVESEPLIATREKDSEKEEAPEEQNAESDSSNGNKVTDRGYVAPSRISIQVMNSSDEETDDSDREDAVREDESDDELVVTVNEERDIQDLLPPEPQNEPEEKEEEKKEEPEPPKKPDRLADLRERLAAITRSNSSASYSPLLSIPASKLTPTSTSFLQTPTTCKFWPTCSFGDNCMYTHPKCKFGDMCTKRPNCPYKHESNSSSSDSLSTTTATTTTTTISTSTTSSSAVKKPTFSTPPGKKACMYFPSCHSMDCTFYHPRPCRFGNGCVNPRCYHYHPNQATRKIPSIQQLKWTKTKPDETSQKPSNDSTTIVTSTATTSVSS